MRAMAAASSGRAGRDTGVMASNLSSTRLARKIASGVDRRALDLLAIDEDMDLDRVLDRVLLLARAAAGARYAALGVPDGRGGFARFLTAGISERRSAQIGELPRVHGVLGALL